MTRVSPPRHSTRAGPVLTSPFLSHHGSPTTGLQHPLQRFFFELRQSGAATVRSECPAQVLMPLERNYFDYDDTRLIRFQSSAGSGLITSIKANRLDSLLNRKRIFGRE